MFPKFDFIRRFATGANRVTELLVFNIEVEVDLTEDEIIEELEVRGHGVLAGH